MALPGVRKKRKLGNIIDYVAKEQRDFAERALSDPDLLAFSALAYLEFEQSEELSKQLPARLEVLAEHPRVTALTDGTYAGAAINEILHNCAQSRRMRDCVMDACAAYTSMDEITQFGACCLMLNTHDPLMVVSFRGTGSDLTGWHEDFNLAVTKAVPSQLRAVAFLEEMAARHPSARIVLTGHSKGGALAEYAALFCSPQVSERIEKSVVFDAPGLFGLGSEVCREFVSFDRDVQQRYEEAPFPLVRYVFPMFVGLMLEPRPLECMHYCEGIPGKFPHDVTAVHIKDGEFVLRVPSTRELLRGTAINRWVEQMTLDDRQCFIDSVFAEYYTNGIPLDFTKLADMRTWAWLFSMHFARAGMDKRKQLGRIMGIAAREFNRR